MSGENILEVAPLQTPWQTSDPFLFCMHHDDRYPEGNELLGPDESLLQGRNLGNDFSGKDGWSMYHGRQVPGFPQHPHCGFETITLARNGFIDHTDSLGAASRFGEGDVQWMTAGNGIVHSEMFPLVNPDGPNPTELLQIWLNLPREDKQKDPYFTMFWRDRIPRPTFEDGQGNETRVTLVAGGLEQREPPEPPPSSWAARDDSEVAVWMIDMEAEATWTLPFASSNEVNRTLYFFEGDRITVEGQQIDVGRAIEVRPDADLEIQMGQKPGELLMLQGTPIEEPVVQQGPFVVNHSGELRQVMLDYQQTRFGGWPWDDDAPVHPRARGRFAVHADGTEQKPADSSQ